MTAVWRCSSRHTAGRVQGGDTTPFSCSREPCAIVMLQLLHRKHSTCTHTYIPSSHSTSNMLYMRTHPRAFCHNSIQTFPIKSYQYFYLLLNVKLHQCIQSLSISLRFDTSVSGGGQVYIWPFFSVGHTNARSLNAAAPEGTGHPYCLCECVWGFVLRLKGFHIPLARRSEVTVYTMLPPACRFNPFCPKAES